MNWPKADDVIQVWPVKNEGLKWRKVSKIHRYTHTCEWWFAHSN